MSAALSCFSAADLFWYPGTYVVKSTYDHVRLITNMSKSLHSRTVYDHGHYSEPIMYLMVYKDWLKAAHDPRWDKSEWCDQRKLYLSRMKDFNLEVCI
jgi:hypothetical protein